MVQEVRKCHEQAVVTVDVAIVGFGPTGMVLAGLLGQQGWKVAVVERYKDLYNLPRAAAFDDETMRTFQKLGVAEKLLPGLNVQRGYTWVNAKNEVLLDIEYDNPGANGWPAQYMMYQPHLEATLDDKIRSLDNVSIYQGATVVDIHDDESGVCVEAVSSDTNLSIEADYLVGADGGNGFTRSHIGTPMDDYGFSENWLVCDFKLQHEVEGLPTFRQVCNPDEPIAIVNIGPKFHRFSFRLEADDDREEVTNPVNVWPRVADYLQPSEAELIRVANYRFRSRIAETWRSGRVLLAGDAAHEMPPFLAQGMVSGIRDARNLAWKLNMVLNGASDTLLDTYQQEREPHVRAITERAIELGYVQTMRDKEKAKLRDERMLAARAANHEPDKFIYPPLKNGLIANHGGIFPQGLVSSEIRTGLFDDVVEGEWIIATVAPSVTAQLSKEDSEAFIKMGGAIHSFGIGSMFEGGDLSDTGGVYSSWFRDQECVAAVIRPDGYLYGTARNSTELATLLSNLNEQIVSTEVVRNRDAESLHTVPA